MEKKNELILTLQGLLSSHEESDAFSASEDFSSKITEVVSELTSKVKKEEPKLDVTVLCEFMTPSENELLWEMLSLYTNSLIDTLTEDEENEAKSDGEEDADEEAKASNKTIIVTMLRKVTSVLSQYFELSTLTPRPNSFFLTIQSLHNILVPLDEDIAGANELKQSIARLCERAWHQDEVGCELLMTQLIPFLLLNVLDSCNTRDSDVKRLYAIRDAFSLLDYEDESIQTIQGLLLRCFTDPSFLKIPEGRRFLSFTFALHADLHNLIVGVMKPQLGTGNKSVSQAYGDILYRAWRDLNITASATAASKDSSSTAISSTSGEPDPSVDEEITAALLLRASLEDNLQDMAHHAIHARERKYFKSLRIVLNVFHENKNNKSVDSLLLKVYGPIMWRSLRCAHPLVRMQAAIIFFDCFPLQSSDHTSNIRETEQLLQKQFDLLHTLLKDGDHRVRAVAAYGVCKVLRTFWEVIPTGTTHQILSYVVSTLGVDASCANVRASVINGMSELLENPLSHIVMKGLLPLLSHSVHDYSERVRASFLRLLCKIKTTRGFKFYDIVSIDQLCNQMSADVHRPVICSIMTELLLNSFYPRASAAGASSSSPVKSNEYGVEQIKRCLQFSRSHPDAAIVFYSNLYLHTSVGSSTKMCVGLWNTLRDNLQRAPSAEALADEREQWRVRRMVREEQESSKKKGAAAKSNKRGNKRHHEDEEDNEGGHGAHAAFAGTVSLCHQILLVLTALIKSTQKLLLSHATYKLSKEMLLTHVSSSSMKAMLIRLLDFQKTCVADEEGGEEGEGSKASAAVAARVQLCISQMLEVIAMVSTISGDSCGSEGKSNGRGSKGKGKAGSNKSSERGQSSHDEDAGAIFTAEGIISLYFANPNENHETASVVSTENDYASSILDAAIALHKAQDEVHPLHSKKSGKSRASTIKDEFILWSYLKDKCTSMYNLLCSAGVGEEEDEDLSEGKNLGKRKLKQKPKSSSRGTRRSYSSIDKIHVVTGFCKAVQLILAMLEGKGNSITKFREEVLNSDETFVKISSIFSVVKNILDKLVNGDDCDGDESYYSSSVFIEGQQEGEVEVFSGGNHDLLFRIESSIILSVKLWLSVLCQRAALKEDSHTDVDVCRGAAAMHISSDHTEEVRDEGGESTPTSYPPSTSATAAELSLSLTWITNTVLAAFQLHSQNSISNSKSMTTTSHKKSHNRNKQHEEQRSSICPLSFLDNLLATSLSVLTDALLSGIASEAILSHVHKWVSLFLQSSENISIRSKASGSNTVNAMARLAFAIFSTKIRFPLLNPSISPDEVDSMSVGQLKKLEKQQQEAQQTSMRAFDATLHCLWEACVDCILSHVQHNSYSSPTESFRPEHSDDEEENAGGDTFREQTDSIDLRILYSMLQLPNNIPAVQNAQSYTQRTQYKFATALMKRILHIVSASASVNEESLKALLNTSTSSLVAVGEEAQVARKQHLLSAEILKWSKRGTHSYVLLDILLRKVCVSDSVSKVVLKILRSMLLDALERRDPAAGGEETRTAEPRDALLLAVLLKQVMAKAPNSQGQGQGDVGGEGAGLSLTLIMSSLEKQLIDADKEKEQQATEEAAGVETAAVVKRSDLSQQIMSLLRL